MVLETDPERARAIGRPRVQKPYLGLTNYLSNLRRLGWTDADFADGGSDALIDALVLHGDAEAIARGITAHLDAGADHVAIQVLDPDPRPALRALAGQLQLPAADGGQFHGYTSAVPISPFLVTRAASSSAASPPVPAGRAGSTM